MPTLSVLNGFLFIQASPQASHTLSRHIGSFSPLARLSGWVGRQTYSSLPSLSVVPFQSFTMAVLAIIGGAALRASLINASLPWALAAEPARRRITVPRIAISSTSRADGVEPRCNL